MFFFIQNPLMLLGLFATAIPVLLHLQKRRSAKTVRFPSLELLNSIHRKKRFSLKLREILLLILRTILIFLLVMALSGVQWERTGRVIPESLYSQHVPKQVFLMDTSYSMGYREGGKTRLQKTVEAAQVFLEESRAGQSFLVLPFADGIDPVALQTVAFESNVEKIRQDLENLKATGETTNVLKTLRQISTIFEDTYQNRIWIFTDLQESGWNEVIRFAANDEQLFRSLPETVILPVVTSGMDNFYLQRTPSRSQLPKVLGEAFPLTLSAVSAGFSSEQIIPLTMKMGGELVFDDGSTISSSIYDKRTRLIGNDRQELEVPLVPLEASGAGADSGEIEFAFWEGSATLELETEKESLDRLTYDNTVRWTIPVLWNLPTLLIETAVPTIASRVLQVCLNPYGGEDPFFIQPGARPSSDISLDGLSQFPVVVMQEGVWNEMDESNRENVLRYVREGGNLIAFITGKEESELTKACGIESRPATDLKEPLLLTFEKGSGPVAASLNAFTDENLTLVYLYEAVRLDGLDREWMLAESLSASAAARIHFPVMGEKEYGRGKCVFIGTGLSGEKSDLASSVLFLPLMHQTLKYLVMDKVPQLKQNSDTPVGDRTESNLRMPGDEMLNLLADNSGLILLKKEAPMVGKRKIDLSVLLLWLVLILALAEVWIANRRL